MRGIHIFFWRKWQDWLCRAFSNTIYLPLYFQIINAVRITLIFTNKCTIQFFSLLKGRCTLVTRPVPSWHHGRKTLLWESAKHVPHSAIFQAGILRPHVSPCSPQGALFFYIHSSLWQVGENYDMAENSQKRASIEWADPSYGNTHTHHQMCLHSSELHHILPEMHIFANQCYHSHLKIFLNKLIHTETNADN